MEKNPERGVKKLRVRRYAKKITMLEEKILEDGEMNSREIHDWFNERIRMGVTMNWVTNVMKKSGLFDKTGDQIVGGLSGPYKVCVWDSRRRCQ